MPSRWSGRDTQTLSAVAMSALLLASAGKHFEDPGFFGPVVPDFLCRDDSGEQSNGPLAVLSREEWVAVSGLLEAGCRRRAPDPGDPPRRRRLRRGHVHRFLIADTSTPCAGPTARTGRPASAASTPCGCRCRRRSSPGPGADSARGTGPAVKLLQSPAVRVGLSISIATGLYGVSFGALSVTSGLDFWQTMALSLLLFSGGSQFAFIGVVAGGGSGVAAMGAATLLGMRNGIYGMQINALLQPRGWRRFAAAQRHHRRVHRHQHRADGSGSSRSAASGPPAWAIFVLWNLFTAVGALAGSALGDPKQWGLDGAAVAAFLGLLWPRLKGREPVAIAVVCALATVLAVPFVPAGVPILVAAVVAAAIGWFSHGRSDEGLEPDVDPYAEHHHRHTAAPATRGCRMNLWMWLLLACAARLRLEAAGLSGPGQPAARPPDVAGSPGP